jgi:ribosome maturation factor RimP
LVAALWAGQKRTRRPLSFFDFLSFRARESVLRGLAVYRDIPTELCELIEPVVEAHGLELVDADLHRGRAPWTLRVIVDTPAGDGRVPVERCAAVSREIATHLDARDAIPVRYRLEVSSPGLSRVLGREKDFRAARGADVALETRRPLDGRRRFRGRLLDLEAETLRLEVEGGEVAIPFGEVAKARTVYRFTREDFARKAAR